MKISLAIKNIRKNFAGIIALDDLSMEFKKGSIIGIIGPNGSGKTTLANILSGIITNDNGLFVFDEFFEVEKINPNETAFYKISRTFQDVRLFNQMSVLDNVLTVISEKSIFDSIFSKHIDFHLKKTKKILKETNLWGKRNCLAANLSYGQKKLLEMARIMASDTEIIIFDEIFSGLFPEMIGKIVDIIKRLKDEGKTVIVIEHNMKIIIDLCDHVYVLDDGHLLAEGRPEKVLEEKKVLEAYLGK